MEFLEYLLKSVALLTVFYLVYEISLQKTTFFKANRAFLLFGLIITALLPLIVITREIVVQLPSETPLPLSYAHAPSVVSGSQTPATPNHLLLLYLTGLAIAFLFFLIKLTSLLNLLSKSSKIKKDRHIYIKSTSVNDAFSFFKYIFYNPTKYDHKQLKPVLLHEKAHADQWHTLDLLLVEIFAVFYWFNPLIWFYKQKMARNLEFLADRAAVQCSGNLKEYQYLLLQKAVKSSYNSLVTPFNNSLTKKRIEMLNTSKSSKSKIISYLLVLPCLVIFMMAFNGKTVKLSEADPATLSSSQTIEFVITASTTDAQLAELSKKVKEKFGGSFAYKKVKRNKAGLITSISLQYDDKNGNKIKSAYKNSEGIEKIMIGSKGKSGVYIYSGAINQVDNSEDVRIEILSDDEDDQKRKVHTIVKQIGTNDTDIDINTVVITDEKGKVSITANGKEIDIDSLHLGNVLIEEIHAGRNNIKIVEKKEGTRKVKIVKVIDDEVEKDNLHNVFVVEGDDTETVFMINGEVVDANELKETLKKKDIEIIEVLKNDKKGNKKKVISVITKE